MNLINHVLFTSLLFFTPITLASTPTLPPQIIKEAPIQKVKSFDLEVHRLAEKYGQNETLAREIIRCEGKMYKERGNNKNYDKNGNVWSEDVGWWQINNYYHQASALRIGYDIYNEWDNLEYGFILLKSQGIGPWSASQHCWGHILGV